MWVVGVQTQVFMPEWQALYPLSHLLSSRCFNLEETLTYGPLEITFIHFFPMDTSSQKSYMFEIYWVPELLLF